MKRSLFIGLTILIALAFVQCVKEGPKGKTGAAGKDGNANVITYLFTDSAKIAWNWTEIQLPYDSVFSIPDTILNGGMILCYTLVKANLMWYPVPGLGYGGYYDARVFFNSTAYYIAASDPDGTIYSGSSLPEMEAVKLVLVPASTLVQIRDSGYIGNFRDHDEAMEILGRDCRVGS